MPNGELRIIPTDWTDLRPRMPALSVGGRSVLLAPESVKKIARWVDARRTQDQVNASWVDVNSGCDHQDAQDGSNKSNEGRRRASKNGGARFGTSSAPVVEQADASNVDRRDEGEKGGDGR